MNFHYIFLLLLIILASESSQHGKPPDPFDLFVVAVCPNSSSDSLGVLAPVLPDGEMFRPVLPQNMVLPQNEVYRTVLPEHEVFGSVLQNGVFKFDLSQTEVNKTVLPQNGLFNNVFVNCQLSDKVKNTVNSLFNIGDKSMEFLISTMIHGVENLAWAIKILFESLQHVLKMYTWSLSENQASIRFKCRLC